jgi:hypothetical protein
MTTTLAVVILALAPWVAWEKHHNCDGTLNIKTHFHSHNLQCCVIGQNAGDIDYGYLSCGRFVQQKLMLSWSF